MVGAGCGRGSGGRSWVWEGLGVGGAGCGRGWGGRSWVWEELGVGADCLVCVGVIRNCILIYMYMSEGHSLHHNFFLVVPSSPPLPSPHVPVVSCRSSAP